MRLDSVSHAVRAGLGASVFTSASDSPGWEMPAMTWSGNALPSARSQRDLGRLITRIDEDFVAVPDV
ncbi:hypothetical protein VR44_24405 [Streptomyces katrae]|uniref:Uncharacterized protein n=1 Tax=Streptomyces katrae TaxID=68223 RepID=A0A0F4J7B4_9ACTN|nr:hypothetical protein VR44_24405 [Streptomyces katrae]